jgi:hypothetical protein
VSLSIVVTVTDAAGNTASNVALGTGPVAVHVVGPPLWIDRDITYPAIADPNSTFPYYVANNTYPTLWSGSFIDGQIRLIRYIVSNPTATWAALNATSAASWSIHEALSVGASYGMPCNCAFDGTYNTQYCADGFTYQGCDAAPGYRIDWSTRNFESTCGWQTNTYGHRAYTSTQFECFPGSVYPTKFDFLPFESARDAASGTITTAVFKNPQPQGQERIHADVVNGWSLVPPATITGPGQLVVYVTRPLIARSTAAYPFTFTDLGYGWTGGWSGQNWVALMGRDMSVASGAESLNGSVTFSTQAVTPAKDARFGAAIPTGSDSFSNIQLTTH